MLGQSDGVSTSTISSSISKSKNNLYIFSHKTEQFPSFQLKVLEFTFALETLTQVLHVTSADTETA